ncbi:MAG: pyridoxal-phosphate dependent enzyme [Bacteroidales bacterium]|jgi:threonine dehydratase|nr:pyridoxal-phosphate dependent enzyme [Bacteroidales bacterium]MDD2571007.1 pyridoxal-phosphate dependent enzyme [Bacteroidales bacterium]MDD2813792.1 pyridoxal-phosphate dependent enzyme [Bacteroidales bacterium]MDD3384509.1 pyridoxal-phosphate dependent enzyme [Bacteroidales bacterium]MDD3811641.1 pyridoxal-phosphate dependent enzyme [Bacteroidales bacterium]
MVIPSLSDIQTAHSRIRSFIHRTPVLTSTSLNRILGAEFFFKCENFQKVGAFKYRGATNAILSLTPAELEKGVGTHSSGNHAAALALAAAMAGVPAYIVMPHTAPAIKKAAVAGYGAHIVFCEPTQEEREKTMMKVQEETGCTFIHPYDRFEIIAGQGTAALELLEEIPTVDIIMAPVGGGGLLSGTAIAAKGLKPDIQVWAGEPQNADDAFKSFYSGELHPSINPKTIADGLLTSLSELTFKAIRENADAILLAPEQLIMDALNLILQRMKIVIEPSSAVPLAALMAGPEKHWKGKKIGIILSGGNLDMAMFASQIKPD